MNIEESLIELKNYIKDKTNPHFDNYGFATVRAKQIQAIETLLTAYEKEKEKNRKYLVNLTHEQYIKLVEQIRSEINEEWNDKIKAKIEELERDKNKLYKEQGNIEEIKIYSAIDIIKAEILRFKEFLEKE